MRLNLAGRSFTVNRYSLFGLILVGLGAALLLISFLAQGDIDRIGATDDPALQERVSVLEDERDTYLIAGFGSFFVGLFALFTLVERTVALIVSESQMISSAKSASDVVAALALAGNAAYLPAKHGLTREKMFVPAPKDQMTPPTALSDDLTLSPGKDGSSAGLLVEPFGLGLLDSIEKELGLSFKDVGAEAAEGQLQALKLGYSIMRDFHFKERGDRTVLRVEYSGLADACRRVRTEKPDTCRQMACFGCSCLMTALTRSTGKIVAVESVDNSQDSVVFTLSLSEW